MQTLKFMLSKKENRVNKKMKSHKFVEGLPPAFRWYLLNARLDVKFAYAFISVRLESFSIH